MTPKEFFNIHPNAPGVLKVGTQLFLITSRGAAVDHARRHGLQVEEIRNNGGPDDTGDNPTGGSPDDTGDNPTGAGPDEKKPKAPKGSKK